MISQCAAELNAWREVKDGWRPLYGDVDQFGVAVEWHDFRTARSFDWGKSFHPRSLEFCLNLEGHGQVGAAGRPASGESRADSMVSSQSARTYGAFSFRSEESGIFLHAAKTRRARAGRARQAGPGARPRKSSHAGNDRSGSRLQSVLSKQDFFPRSRSDHSAVFAQAEDGTRGGVG